MREIFARSNVNQTFDEKPLDFYFGAKVFNIRVINVFIFVSFNEEDRTFRLYLLIILGSVSVSEILLLLMSK